MVLQMSERPSEERWLHLRGGAFFLGFLISSQKESHVLFIWFSWMAVTFFWFTLNVSFIETHSMLLKTGMHIFHLDWNLYHKSLFSIFSSVDISTAEIKHAKASHSVYTPISYSIVIVTQKVMETWHMKMFIHHISALQTGEQDQ